MHAVLYPLAVIGYPIICHLAAVSGHPELALVWLGLATAYAGWRSGSWVLPILICALALLALWPRGGRELGDAALRIPPIAIPAALAFVFAESLRPGRTPIVNLIGSRVHGPLAPRVADYGRGLTRFWIYVLIGLALEALLLALFADAYWWSLFTNFLNYGIVAAVFVGEYAWRRRVLTVTPHSPFLHYVRDVLRAGLRTRS